MSLISKRLLAVIAALVCVAAGVPASASSFVKIQFNLSLETAPYDTVYLELFDDTPATQANFLNYVNDGDYDGILMHRLAYGFVLQGGGFDLNLDPIATDPQVVNEFGRSNLRGTLAMAKLAAPEDGGPPNGGPDSATNQFFFNLADNSANLDNQNGGFTVFARVLGNGMDLIDAFATLPLLDLGAPFDTLPVLKTTSGNIPVIMQTVTQVQLIIGDTNLDGSVDQNDADLLASTLVGGTDEPQFDVDRNGITEQADLNMLNDLLKGDLNGDGFVGISDLDIVLAHWNQTVTPGDAADPSGDGYVGIDDLDSVLGAWNLGTPPVPAVSTPEPTAALLLGLGASAFTLRRRA